MNRVYYRGKTIDFLVQDCFELKQQLSLTYSQHKTVTHLLFFSIYMLSVCVFLGGAVALR